MDATLNGILCFSTKYPKVAPTHLGIMCGSFSQFPCETRICIASLHIYHLRIRHPGRRPGVTVVPECSALSSVLWSYCYGLAEAKPTLNLLNWYFPSVLSQLCHFQENRAILQRRTGSGNARAQVLTMLAVLTTHCCDHVQKRLLHSHLFVF